MLVGPYDFDGYTSNESDTPDGGTNVGWALRLGALGQDRGHDVKVDSQGNVYLVGFFNEAAAIGDVTHLGHGGDDMLLVSLTSAGEYRWSRSFGGVGSDRLQSLALDAKGNLILIGQFTDTVEFGASIALTSLGSSDVVIAALSRDGTTLWAKSLGGSGYDEGDHVLVDAFGNIIAVGEFAETATFGNSTFTSNGSLDIFVTTLSPTGDVLQTSVFGGEGTDAAFGASLNKSGHLVLSGYFSGSAPNTLDFGGGPLDNHGPASTMDAFVASLSPSGFGGWTHSWSHSFGGQSLDEATRICAGKDGDLFVTGLFSETMDAGTGVLASAGDTDGFLLSLTPLGVTRWVKQFGGPGTDDAGGCSIDSEGNITFAGKYRGAVDVSGTPLPTADGAGVLVANYSPGGVVNWVRGFPATGDVLTIRTAAAGQDAFVTGEFAGILTFDETSLESTPDNASPSNSRDLYLLKVVPPTQH